MDLFQVIGWLWTYGLAIPMTNCLVLLARLSFGNFGAGIILFTLLMRGLTWPLTRQQLQASRMMADVQPRIQAIQKQHKDPKRRSEETMKLYREAGVSPLGCVLPMLVQFPIWIALYQAIRFTLGNTPENVLSLSQRLYPWSYLRTAIPLNNRFLWMNLAQPDTTLIMAVVVGVSAFLQQRMTMPMRANADPQQQQVNNTMLWMMPMMFAFFTLQFPSGLALYWVATNVVGIVLQYFYQGPSQFNWRQIFSLRPTAQPSAPSALRPAETSNAEEKAPDETGPAKRKRRRRRGRQRRR